jgi:hypothetical protein
MSEPWELMLDAKSKGGNASFPAPKLCIALLTFLRTTMAVRTVQGIVDHLDYPKELVSFYVADDGSPKEHMDAIFKAITDGGYSIAGYHNQRSIQNTPFCGIGWNKALRKAHDVSDYIMLLEDDWVLKQPMDIRPFMWTLKEVENVGIIRLSGLTTDNILQVMVHRGTHYFQYLRSRPFCYSGNPHIRHLRFTEYYGLFAIDVTPGDIEVYYDAKFHRLKDGPNIWRPCDQPAWGIFSHIGNARTW